MMLPRGFATAEELELSNQHIFAEFNRLAWYATRQYQRTYGLTEDRTEELYRNLLVCLFAAPLSYRNPRGISKIIATKLAGLRHRVLSLERETGFNPAVHESACQFDDSTRSVSGDYMCSNSRLDLGAIASRFHVLSSSERAVVRLLYGVDGARPFNVATVSRKLGRPPYWVNNKLQSAVLKLQRALGLPEKPISANENL